jgi:hypothetical protein
MTKFVRATHYAKAAQPMPMPMPMQLIWEKPQTCSTREFSFGKKISTTKPITAKAKP